MVCYTSRTTATTPDALGDPCGHSTDQDMDAQRVEGSGSRLRTPTQNSCLPPCFCPLWAPSSSPARPERHPKLPKWSPFVHVMAATPLPLQMTSPLARGLFHRAISQSGTAVFQIFITPDPLKVAKVSVSSLLRFSKGGRMGTPSSTSSLHRRLPSWQAAITTAQRFW